MTRGKRKKVCKDCKAEGLPLTRVAKYPGPRCATHHRQRKKELKARNHAKHVSKTFGLTSEEYRKLYEAQGGRCFVCQRATGKRRKLAVDHDHETGFVRGLLCKTCNYRLLGYLRDDTEAFQRAIDYINNPPAFKIIGKKRVPDA